MKTRNLFYLLIMSSLSLNFETKEDFSKGMIIAEPYEYFLPSFPRITMYNKKDTFEYTGNIVGQINYSIPPGEYLVKVEPGKDEITGENGDFFKKYEIKINFQKGNLPMKKISKN